MDFRAVVLFIMSSFLQILGEEGEFEQMIEKDQESSLLTHLILGTPTADLFNPCPNHSTGLAGKAFSKLINILIISECLLAAPCTYPFDRGGECQLPTVYDFIVVGGGTAGSVIAARLSEVRNWKVLLLEAGGNPPMSSDVPFFYNSLLRSEVDWWFKAESERGLFNGFMGRENRWPRGKVLGGTSTINTMLYVRGIAKEFDNLAGHGMIGWSYSEVLKYFKKAEDMRDAYILSSPAFSTLHARGGPLTLSTFGGVDFIMELIEKAGASRGYPTNYDVNGPNLGGFMTRHQGTIRNGERLNTAKAFLNPVKKRKNLYVIKHSYVSKILICHKTSRAYGVEYYYRNEKTSRVVRVSKEVIVSAGTISTPRLLMLSGIGPKRHLDDLKIFIQQDLPVGKNLRDHLAFPGIPVTIDTGLDAHTPLDILDYAYEYLTRRTGHLSRTGATEVLGYLNIIEDDTPDILVQFKFFMCNETEALMDFVKSSGFVEDIARQFFEMIARKDLLIAMPVLLHPKSKGYIQLKSSDPDDMPLIYSGYLNQMSDLDTLIKGIRIVEHLMKSRPMRCLNATIELLNFPGCCGLDIDSEAYWACSISHIAGTGHNQVGTCKMGCCNDSSSVVNYKLKVNGIHGLRVADASVIPQQLSALPLATTVMIGEKVCDMIKMEWIKNYHPFCEAKKPPLVSHRPRPNIPNYDRRRRKDVKRAGRGL